MSDMHNLRNMLVFHIIFRNQQMLSAKLSLSYYLYHLTCQNYGALRHELTRANYRLLLSIGNEDLRGGWCDGERYYSE